MDREEFIKKLEPVRDIEISETTSLHDLVEEFGKIGGFVASKVYKAAKILEEMLTDPKSFNFLSLPAAVISTGLRGVIKEFIKRGYFDAIITTSGFVDHDVARCYRDYYQGYFDADDVELRNLEIHRLGSVFIPYENYGVIMEEVTQRFLKNIYSKGVKHPATFELLEELGRFLDECPNREESIIWWAAKRGVKIFIPGITDGAFGYQIWFFYQDHRDFNLDLLKDESKLSDIVYENEVTGGLSIGGGISKHHLIWWNQFKNGLDRAVYITTAPEWDGSLSGARTREAITWNKIGKTAKHITVEGDATVILPIIAGYLIKNIKKRIK
ncbi:MAG: deoxyhypusine synthase [Candidatus Njordarchaeia archaeon]